jgi:hypothetical protein
MNLDVGVRRSIGATIAAAGAVFAALASGTVVAFLGLARGNDRDG